MPRTAEPLSALTPDPDFSINEEGWESEGRFSHRVVGDFESNARDVTPSSTPTPGCLLHHEVNLKQDSPPRPSLSLLLIVDRIFRALHLSPVVCGKKQALFWIWIVWFFARGVFLIVGVVTASSFIDPDTYVCLRRNTMISPRGFPNRDAQSIIVLFDFFGWVLIFLSGFGGSLHYFPRLCSHPEYIWLHSNFEKCFMAIISSALFFLRLLMYLLPVFNAIGNTNCNVATVEEILATARYNSNCSDAISQILLATAFDRRSTRGNSLSLLSYDVLVGVSMVVVSIVIPLRFLTLCNCASRALRKVIGAHFSPQFSTFHPDSFFSDFGLVNNIMIRLHRQLGFQIVLVTIFNIFLTVVCLVEIQLSFVLNCFRMQQHAYPFSFLYFKTIFNSLRIASAAYALGCCLVPVCAYNSIIQNLAVQVSALLQSENKLVLADDIARDWLNPQLVMSNTCSVRPSVLERRTTVMSSMTDAHRIRLSNMLSSLKGGDFSFKLAGVLELRFRHIITFYSIVISVFVFMSRIDGQDPPL